MLAAVQQRIEAAKAADPNEFEQAKVRLIFFIAISLYLFVWVSLDGAIDEHEVGTLWLDAGLGALDLAHSSWMLLSPGPNVLRRHAAALLDLGAITAFMVREEIIYSPVFGLYLWVIIGNGFRFGLHYLFYSQVLALGGFTVVWIFTDFWRANPHLSAGLLLVLVIVPLYVSFLISRLRAAGQRLDVARHQAETANLSKTKFLAAASHDLRQPMQALSMYASVLEQTVADPAARRVVNGVALSVRTLEQLFDSLLDVSRIETGVIKPNIVAFPLMPLIERVVEAERPIAAQKGLAIRVVRTAASVSSDPLLLERMLKNLLTNAVRYTVRGKIVVGCRRAGRGRLRLAVVDSGVGIAAHEQDRIFNEYYQIDGASAQGLGLGLTIVKSLGDLLRHPVSVKSLLGRGSTFSIELDAAHEVPLPAAADAGQRVELGGTCVVVLDDDSEIRGSMGLLLETWGCRCILGATLAEVQQKLRTLRAAPQALIVDYRLAESLTGLEAIERLRGEFGPRIPALVVTGTHHAAGLPKGSDGIPVLTKPAPPGKLRAFLSQAAKQAS